MTPYPYPYGWPVPSAHAVHHSSPLVAVGIVVAALAIEMGVIALIVRWAAAGEPPHDRRRRGQSHRWWPTTPRFPSLPLDGLFALDAHLDEIWTTEVAARRQRAEHEMLRLADSRVPLVGASETCGEAANTSTQFVFADGTTLTVWSAAGNARQHPMDLRRPAVLRAHRHGGDEVRFVTATGEVVIHGAVLVAGGSEQ